MAAVKEQRKCWLMLLLFVYKVCLSDLVQAVASDTESGIVERISRRQNNDIYFFINGTVTNCGDKNTYLVSEDQCVKDQELFKGT